MLQTHLPLLDIKFVFILLNCPNEANKTMHSQTVSSNDRLISAITGTKLYPSRVDPCNPSWNSWDLSESEHPVPEVEWKLTQNHSSLLRVCAELKHFSRTPELKISAPRSRNLEKSFQETKVYPSGSSQRSMCSH